jgi:hypothetical protein
MLTILLSNLLIGAVLGLRFRAYVLLGVIFATAAMAAIIVLLGSYPPGSVLGGLIGSAVALQIGYLLGVLARLPLGLPPAFHGRRFAARKLAPATAFALRNSDTD